VLAATRPRPRRSGLLFLLRVFGRLPVTDSATRSRAGVRKASGEETAGGVCAGGGVEVLQTLPGYGPDVAKNRVEARKIMEKLGYGPDKRLAIKVSTRNFPAWRDPAVIMMAQLKETNQPAHRREIEGPRAAGHCRHLATRGWSDRALCCPLPEGGDRFMAGGGSTSASSIMDTERSHAVATQGGENNWAAFLLYPVAGSGVGA
jgi:hypothetical protein